MTPEASSGHLHGALRPMFRFPAGFVPAAMMTFGNA
jgi:hypothetical protein